MREVDFLDKENGTRNGLEGRLGRRLDDSERNIMYELRHDPCEWHCESCGRCDEGEDSLEFDGAPYCEDCYDDEYYEWLERKDEARREGNLNRG